MAAIVDADEHMQLQSPNGTLMRLHSVVIPFDVVWRLLETRHRGKQAKAKATWLDAVSPSS
jgi:hypothetical protein